MCGIAGFIDFSKKTTEDALRKASDCLQHRGPDGSGVYFTISDQASIGLGHRRLSIIDLSEGANQPMHYNGLHLIFNGEIYNYNEIRDELLSLGHQFQTHSDTEVILHGWEQWGEKCIDKWRGMFAIALYDERKREVIFIRDRAGVKPFYYHNNNGPYPVWIGAEKHCIFPRFSEEDSPRCGCVVFTVRVCIAALVYLRKHVQAAGWLFNAGEPADKGNKHPAVLEFV
jgi:asparagine synthase (glutamine-hydrolysing)